MNKLSGATLSIIIPKFSMVDVFDSTKLPCSVETAIVSGTSKGLRRIPFSANSLFSLDKATIS